MSPRSHYLVYDVAGLVQQLEGDPWDKEELNLDQTWGAYLLGRLTVRRYAHGYGRFILRTSKFYILLLGNPLSTFQSQIFDTLDHLSDNYLDNDDVVCHLNDWQVGIKSCVGYQAASNLEFIFHFHSQQARDQRARIMRTYMNGRFSRQHTFWGLPNGRWYCAYKQSTLRSLGQSLDPIGGSF